MSLTTILKTIRSSIVSVSRINDDVVVGSSCAEAKSQIDLCVDYKDPYNIPGYIVLDGQGSLEG